MPIDKINSKFCFSICNELIMYYGIYELYSSIISDTMHSYIILLFIVTVFIFYNICYMAYQLRTLYAHAVI